MLVCPKCGSTNVDRDTSVIVGNLGALPDMYVCNDCENTSPFFPEIDKDDLPKFRKEIKAQPKSEKSEQVYETVDLRYGNFLVLLWKLLGFLGIIIGLIIAFFDLTFGLVIIAASLFQLAVAYKKDWIKLFKKK